MGELTMHEVAISAQDDHYGLIYGIDRNFRNTLNEGCTLKFKQLFGLAQPG
jgi:hypothetical protein